MIEPASILLAKAVGLTITASHKTAQAAIEKTKDTQHTDLEHTLANLTAADAAIQGLGREWEDLLATAKRCPPRDIEA